jgi:hypothetical protein
MGEGQVHWPRVTTTAQLSVDCIKDWRSYNIRYAAHWTCCGCVSVRIDHTGCTLGATGAT